MVTNTTLASPDGPFARRLNVLFSHASALIGVHHSKVTHTYRRHPACELIQYAPGKENRIIDLAFKKEKAVLTGLFDSEQQCDYVIITFSSPISPEQCITYLNDTYAYDKLVDRWILPNYRLSIHGAEEGICLSISR